MFTEPKENLNLKESKEVSLKDSLLKHEFLSIPEINDQLPSPRCVNCNYRMGSHFEDLLECNGNFKEYFKKNPALDYCDFITLFNDYDVYNKLILLKQKEKNKKI